MTFITLKSHNTNPALQKLRNVIVTPQVIAVKSPTSACPQTARAVHKKKLPEKLVLFPRQFYFR